MRKNLGNPFSQDWNEVLEIFASAAIEKSFLVKKVSHSASNVIIKSKPPIYLWQIFINYFLL